MRADTDVEKLCVISHFYSSPYRLDDYCNEINYTTRRGHGKKRKKKKTYETTLGRVRVVTTFRDFAHLVVADVIAVGPEDVEVDDASLRPFAPVTRVRVYLEHRPVVPVSGAVHAVVQVGGQSERPLGHRSHGAGQRV